MVPDKENTRTLTDSKGDKGMVDKDLTGEEGSKVNPDTQGEDLQAFLSRTFLNWSDNSVETGQVVSGDDEVPGPDKDVREERVSGCTHGCQDCLH